MEMEKRSIDWIPPYRMAQIAKTAADVADRITSGKYLFNPTYQECEIIVELVAEAIRKCKDE